MRYWLAFAACAAAAAVPLAVTAHLPMIDLPEHMAQVALWKHLHDPCYQFSSVFEINLATPYFLSYAVARGLAAVMSVEAAVKATVWLTIVLLPLAIRFLLTRRGGDPWLSLLGFPLAFGYSFFWGFFNFSLAVPVAIFYLALLYDERFRPMALSALALLLLTAHALMLLFSAAVTVILAGLRRSWRLLLPMLPAVTLLVLWAVRVRQIEAAVHRPLRWDLSWLRVIQFPAFLVSNIWDRAGLALVAVAVLLLLLMRPALQRDLGTWIVLLVAALIYLFAPVSAFGSTFLPHRFAVMVAVGALFVIGTPKRPSRLPHAAMVVIVLVWMSVLAVRFQRFSSEARDFDRLVDALPENRRVLLFNLWPFSESVPGPVFWHYGALYQVRKGGLSAWSFANSFPQVVRYRAGAEPRMRSSPADLQRIDWRGALQYDYIVVRGPDVRSWLFKRSPAPIELRGRSGLWWLFSTPRANVPQRQCAPLAQKEKPASLAGGSGTSRTSAAAGSLLQSSHGSDRSNVGPHVRCVTRFSESSAISLSFRPVHLR